MINAIKTFLVVWLLIMAFLFIMTGSFIIVIEGSKWVAEQLGPLSAWVPLLLTSAVGAAIIAFAFVAASSETE